MKNYYELEDIPGLVTMVQVYDLYNSALASGYAMVADLKTERDDDKRILKRVSKLGKARIGSGHDCFLKGIIVNYNISINHIVWLEFMRYHFHDIVTSQSKMHRLTQMDLRSQCTRFVHPNAIALVEELREVWDMATDPVVKKEAWRTMLDSTPLGLKLSARITTNYLQLKSIYNQRKNHKMEEWVELCKWMETLPYFKEFIL